MTMTTTVLSSPSWPVSTPSVSTELSHFTWAVLFFLYSFCVSWRKSRVIYLLQQCLCSRDSVPVPCSQIRWEEKNPLISFVRDLDTKNSGWTLFWQRSQRKVYLIERLSWAQPSDNADKAVEVYTFCVPPSIRRANKSASFALKFLDPLFFNH